MKHRIFVENFWKLVSKSQSLVLQKYWAWTILCIYFNESKNLFWTFTRHLGLRIIPFKRYQDCSCRFKINEEIRGNHLTWILRKIKPTWPTGAPVPCILQDANPKVAFVCLQTRTDIIWFRSPKVCYHFKNLNCSIDISSRQWLVYKFLVVLIIVIKYKLHEKLHVERCFTPLHFLVCITIQGHRERFTH